MVDSSATEDSREPHTFVFADLAGFTALTEAHGDDSAAEVAEGFADQVRVLLAQHAGSEVKAIGDAIMAHMTSAEQAVRLGLGVVGEFDRRHQSLAVRVGMHTGPAVERNGDWFGSTVNLAARVTAVARGCEVLLTETTMRAAGPIDGVEIRDKGEHRFKNVSQRVRLFAAEPADARALADWPIDPVCKMAVDPERGAGHLIHTGRTYYFCSLGCAAKFARNPGAYL